MNASIHRSARLAAIGLCMAAVSIFLACGDDDNDASSTPAATATRPVSAATPVPGQDQRATLRGTLTLDGQPLNADFLGVRVVREGLSAACQQELPSVTGGAYDIGVVSDAEVRGCGAPGAQIVLWAFANDQFVYSQQTTPWPGNGGEATFDATFSSAAPLGATTPVSGFKGLLYGPNAVSLPGGTVVEAFIGDTRCGVTSLRYGDVTEGYYTLAVAGPDAIPACAKDATITFRLDGKPAIETAVNDLRNDEPGHEVNLTLR
jgi:hypothetical protein